MQLQLKIVSARKLIWFELQFWAAENNIFTENYIFIENDIFSIKNYIYRERIIYTIYKNVMFLKCLRVIFWFDTGKGSRQKLTFWKITLLSTFLEFFLAAKELGHSKLQTEEINYFFAF